MLAKGSLVRALSSALVVSTTACGLPGPWEDRVNVRVVFSDDDSVVGASIHRYRYRETDDGWDVTEETCCDTYEVRLVPLEDADEVSLIPQGTEPIVMHYLMSAEGYALASHQDAGYQLWLDETRREPWDAPGTLVPSPTGHHVGEVQLSPPGCYPRGPCDFSVHVYDAQTREEIMAAAIPQPSGRHDLRWLDEDTLLAGDSLARVGEGWIDIVETLPAGCDRTPATTSSSVSADGMRVQGHLEGDDVVLELSPADVPAWPGPCADLLGATGP